MKIAYITAGAGGMICGNCLRDNTLARALIGLGHDVQLIPTYTPIRNRRGERQPRPRLPGRHQRLSAELPSVPASRAGFRQAALGPSGAARLGGAARRQDAAGKAGRIDRVGDRRGRRAACEGGRPVGGVARVVAPGRRPPDELDAWGHCAGGAAGVGDPGGVFAAGRGLLSLEAGLAASRACFRGVAQGG